MNNLRLFLILFIPWIAYGIGSSYTAKEIDRISVNAESQITLSDTVRFSSGTASTVPYLDANKDLTSSAVTPTELGYVSGVTSALQTQLNAKEGTLTNSAGLAAALSDESGTGVVLFGTGPTISGADFNFGTASNSNRLVLPKDTTTNLDLLTDTQALLGFDTTLNKPVYNDGTGWTEIGSGGGGGSNLNLIIDNSFETDVSEGTCTSCTATQETTIIEATDNNAAALKMAFSASTGDYTDTTATSTYYDGVLGKVEARIKTDQEGIQLCSVVDSAESACIDVDSDNIWKTYSVNSTMSTTNFGYKVKATSSITGNVYVDEVFAGSSPIKTIQTQAPVYEVNLSGNDGRAITVNTESMPFDGTATGWTSGADGSTTTNGNYYTVQEDNSTVTISIGAAFTAQNTGSIRMDVNGSSYKILSAYPPNDYYKNGAYTFTTSELSAGDKIGFAMASATGTLTNDVSRHYLTIVETPQTNKAVVIDIDDDTLTEWTDWTPTGSWTTNTTYDGKYRRVGDTMEIMAEVTLSGAPTAATFTINLPSGYSIDTSKITQADPDGNIGQAFLFDQGTAAGRTMGKVGYSTATSVGIVGIGDTTVSNTTPFTWASGDRIDMVFKVPIVGWTSNPSMMATFPVEDDGYRHAAITSSDITTTADTLVQLTVEKDPYGLVDTANDKFDIDKSGEYQLCVGGNVGAGTSNWAAFYYRINAGGNEYITGLAPSASSGVTMYPCKTITLSAGDDLYLRSQSGSTSAISIVRATLTRQRDEKKVFLGNVNPNEFNIYNDNDASVTITGGYTDASGRVRILVQGKQVTVVAGIDAGTTGGSPTATLTCSGCIPAAYRPPNSNINSGVTIISTGSSTLGFGAFSTNGDIICNKRSFLTAMATSNFGSGERCDFSATYIID